MLYEENKAKKNWNIPRVVFFVLSQMKKTCYYKIRKLCTWEKICEKIQKWTRKNVESWQENLWGSSFTGGSSLTLGGFMGDTTMLTFRIFLGFEIRIFLQGEVLGVSVKRWPEIRSRVRKGIRMTKLKKSPFMTNLI